MFKKLKIKLTLLNLAVAGMILLGMSAISYVIISDNIRSQSQQLLQTVTNNFVIQQTNAGQTASKYYLTTSSENIYPYTVIMIDPEKKATVNASVQTTSVNNGVDLKLGFSTALDQKQIDQVSQIIISDKADIAESTAEIAGKDQNKTVVAVTQKDDIIHLSGSKSYRVSTIYNNGYIFAIMQDMQSEQALLTNVAITLGICVLAGLLLMTFGGLFLAERSLRPIRTSWQKQRDFVADASHELRTPLAAIIGNIDVVMDDPQAAVSDKQLYCEGILEEARRMSLLVDGLLMLARADSDTNVLQKSAVDIDALAKEAVTLMQPVAAAKEIRIQSDITDMPCVDGDASRLKQVLLQLLDNAIKYTQNGGEVKVSVSAAGDKAKICVADNGTGIAKEHQEKIFERFYRVDNSREWETGGHGLGLSIAKFIVEQHGGIISVESEEGNGSTFTVVLPILKKNLKET